MSAAAEESLPAESEPVAQPADKSEPQAQPVAASSVQGNEPAIKNSSNVEPIAAKASNETAAQKPAPPAESVQSDVDENSIKADASPLAPVAKTTVAVPADEKKPETSKPASTKAVEAPKPDEEQKAEIEQEKIEDNLENPEENLNVFDETESSDMPEKDNEMKTGDGPYDDDDEYVGDDMMARNNNKLVEQMNTVKKEPVKFPEEEEAPHTKFEKDEFVDDPDSNFFTYLCILMFLCVFLYILHQNRQKILALFLEGRRGGRRSRERSRNGSKAAYSKLGDLDSNLEEAIMSKKSLNGKSMDIIY